MAAKYQNHYIQNIQVQPFPFSESKALYVREI